MFVSPLDTTLIKFKALFFIRNRLRALSDAILLLAGRCHVGHKNANRLLAHKSACTLVAGTQDEDKGISPKTFPSNGGALK